MEVRIMIRRELVPVGQRIAACGGENHKTQSL